MSQEQDGHLRESYVFLLKSDMLVPENKVGAFETRKSGSKVNRQRKG